MELLGQISESLQKGKHIEIESLTKASLDSGAKPEEILNSALLPGMNIIGEKFRKHEIFLPHVLLAARAMDKSMEILKPLLIKGAVPSMGKIVIGTVFGDVHDLGKNLVGIMLSGAGFEVIDLGKGVTASSFVDTAEKEGAQVIGMSALLTTTMPYMKEVINLLSENGLREKFKVIIGGAPVTESYAKEIGADAYAFDAGYSVECVKNLLKAV